MVVSLTNAVNHPIKLTKPCLGVVNWRSPGNGGGFHHVCTPFQLLQAHASPLATLITSDHPTEEGQAVHIVVEGEPDPDIMTTVEPVSSIR